MYRPMNKQDGPDHQTADRLLAGAVDPDDAPPGYSEVARLIAELRVPGVPSELERIEETTAAMRGTVLDGSPALPGSSEVHWPRPSAATMRVAALALAATIAGTYAAAASGALPGPIQRMTAGVLGRIGISVPTSDGGPIARTDPSGVGRGVGVSNEVPVPALGARGSDSTPRRHGSTGGLPRPSRSVSSRRAPPAVEARTPGKAQQGEPGPTRSDGREPKQHQPKRHRRHRQRVDSGGSRWAPHGIVQGVRMTRQPPVRPTEGTSQPPWRQG
jgi:hypothetical protein